MSNIPTIIVEAAWSSVPITGIVTIGFSTIGGTDTIGSSFAFSNYTTIPETRKVSITRGRSDDLSQVQPGRCVLTLFDPTAKYNPLNAASALNGLLNPMRPIRVRAIDPADGSTHYLFSGFVQTITYNADPMSKECVIECIDLFEWLANSYPTIATQANADCGTIIQTILTAIGWTQSSLTNLDTNGKTIPSFSSDGTKSSLQLIQDLLTVDRGLFFIAGDGTATYRSHATMSKVLTAATTFTQSQASAMKPSTQARLIINGQTVTRTGGVAQTVTDKTSQQSYGVRNGSAISSPWLLNDVQSQSLANWMIMKYKDPQVPARPVALMNQADAGATLTQQLARGLGDYVTVSDNVYGTAVTGFIDQIAHDISDGAMLMTSTFLVTKKNAVEFTIGLSTVGGTDIVGY